MVIFLFFIFCGFVFFREILVCLIFFLSSTKRLGEGNWDVFLQAQKIKIPRVYLLKPTQFATIILKTFFSHFIFISESLWKKWSSEEQEAFVAWAVAASYQSVWARLSGFFNIKTCDRNCVLLTGKKEAFLCALAKAYDFCLDLSPSTLGGLLSGLGFVGPSLFLTWPSFQERSKSLQSYAQK